MTQLGRQVLEPGKEPGRRLRALSGAGAGLRVAQEGSKCLRDGLGLRVHEDGSSSGGHGGASDVGGHDRGACAQSLLDGEGLALPQAGLDDDVSDLHEGRSIASPPQEGDRELFGGDALSGLLAAGAVPGEGPGEGGQAAGVNLAGEDRGGLEQQRQTLLGSQAGDGQEAGPRPRRRRPVQRAAGVAPRG